MTTLQAMQKILKLKEDEPLPELQNLVIEVRQSINGAADPWPIDKLERVAQALDFRLRVWKEPSDAIDECVRIMCKKAIELIDKELDERVAYNNKLAYKIPTETTTESIHFKGNIDYWKSH